MRKNLPVTNVETQLPEGQFIYSRTDLKGVIVEANDAFASLSGFTREEMVGQPHNLVRHPDMPEEAFADLWRDIKAGRPWRGIVKNRRKDGGYYWVVANATPVRENGQIVGYQSVRGRPTREEITAASDAYRRIQEGDRSLYVEHGRVLKRHPAWLTGLLSLRSQMTIIGLGVFLPDLFFGIGTITGIKAFETIHDVLSVLTVLFGFYFLVFFTPRVIRDLEAIRDWLDTTLTTGNLRNRLVIDRRDLIGEVGERADTFVGSVRAVVQGMADSASQVERASHAVRKGVEHVTTSAQTQSEATSSAAAAVEEVTVSIGEVAAHAQSTQSVATETGAVARQGVELSERATTTILSLSGTVKSSAEQVEMLGQRSAEISRIAGVIKEIADQTNLLALNAAIEAARAGEQGRGFAVVADEVRKLAERTGKATQEISGMIAAIQAETGKAVDGMRAGAHQVDDSVNLVHEAQEALGRINAEMGNTMQMVSEITHASSEQSNAMTQLAQNVEQVASMTEANLSVVRETHVMVESLENVVDIMRKAVRQFSV